MEHALDGKRLAGVEFRQPGGGAHFGKRSFDDVGLDVVAKKLVIPDEIASIEDKSNG